MDICKERTCIRSCEPINIRKLIFVKFSYLLNHKNSTVDIKRLMDIPFVEPIIMNASYLPFYFGNIQNKSLKTSKYIGIDAMTNHGFISFWMKKVQINYQECKIITIVFNKTNIHCLYFSDSSDLLTLKYPRQLYSFDNAPRDADDVRAINELLLNGKIRGLSNDEAIWCLNELWQSCMFWPNLKVAFIHPNICLSFYVFFILCFFCLGVILIYKSSA